MGDDIKLLNVEVINGGTFQFDLINKTKNEQIRFFAEPDKILEAMNKKFKADRKQYMDSFTANYQGN
jgi:hypothetical protein